MLDTLRLGPEDLRLDNAAALPAGLETLELETAEALPGAFHNEWIIDCETGESLIARFGNGVGRGSEVDEPVATGSDSS